jgi:hypothetical protein
MSENLMGALKEIVAATHDRKDLTSRIVNKIAFSAIAREMTAIAIEARQGGNAERGSMRSTKARACSEAEGIAK